MSYYKKLLDELGRQETRLRWGNHRHILNVNTGPIDNSIIWDKMATWLAENLGGEAWPMHGVEGDWYMGADTVDDWTLIGFSSEANMQKFKDEFRQYCK